MRHVGWVLLSSGVLLAACGGSSTPSDPLAALLVVPPPAGYSQDPASGRLGLEDAAASTPADAGTVSRELAGDGFDHGWARVWVNGGDFINFTVLGVGSPAAAARVVELERSALRSGQGYATTTLPAVPGSVEYTGFGGTRSGGKRVFCQGVWFSRGDDVFGVTTCSPVPAGGVDVEQLATAQYRAAAG